MGDAPPAALRDGVRHRLGPVQLPRRFAPSAARAAAHRRRQLVPGTRPALHRHQADLAFEAGAVAVSAPMGGEPEIAEVALIRYVIAAMDLVDLHELEAADHEPAPVRHLSVVSA